MGNDARQRRLRQLRAGPVAGGPQLGPSVAERTARYIRAGEALVGGSESHDQSAGNGSGHRWLEELVAAGVTVNVTLTFTTRQYRAREDGVAGHSGGVAGAIQERVQHLRVASGHLHRKARAVACRRRRKGKWASSMRRTSGKTTGRPGRAEDAARSGDHLCEHGHEKARATRRGNTWRRSPAVTSKRTRRRRMTRYRKAAARSRGTSTNCRRKRCSTRSTPKSKWNSSNDAHGRGHPQVRRPAKGLLKQIGEKRKELEAR